MSSLKFIKNHESGASLVELMIATAIGFMIAVQGYMLIENTNKMNQDIVEKYSYMTILASIKSNIKISSFTDFTAQHNSALSACKANISACSGSQGNYADIPINLYKKRGALAVKISGTPASPLIYTKDGVTMPAGTALTARGAKYSISSKAIPLCEIDCPAGKGPQSIRYVVELKQRLSKLKTGNDSTWVLKKKIENFELVRTKDVTPMTTIPCPDQFENEQTIQTFAQGFTDGVLQCSFEELPSELDPVYTGIQGIQGLPGPPGDDGPQGASACILDHYYGGTEYCGTAAGAASYCSSAQAAENAYN